MSKTLALWLAVGWAGFLVPPWFAIEDGFWSFQWLADGYPFAPHLAPAAVQSVAHGQMRLAPIALFLLAPLIAAGSGRARARLLLFSGIGGLGWVAFQGFAAGPEGWEWAGNAARLDALDVRQPGMGWGALLVCASFLFILTHGCATRGMADGDDFAAGAAGLVVALIATFIFLPLSQILIGALADDSGGYALDRFVANITGAKIWGLDCFGGGLSCGAAWNSLLLATLVGAGTTVLGLAFALAAARGRMRRARAFRALTILPVITPPFVVGLAIILLFGASGAFTKFLDFAFGISAGRWIYGLPGLWLAQMLAFTPIAFLVLIGVVEGVSPSMEEAAQTLRADNWKTFQTVSLPLMRPGLANAFLLGFIESMADFGNPIVLGGNYEVLSTEIFFAVVGAQNDQGLAAALAIVLLTFTLGAFAAQRRWLGRAKYAAISGKGDSGAHAPMPRRLSWPINAVCAVWVFLTVVIYGMIVFGGLVHTWGLNHSFTLRHYVSAFSVGFGEHGVQWSGAAWNSFWTTVTIAGIAAPLTAALGLLTAYLLARRRFARAGLFEFGVMLSFAVPGTVVGVSYILAFNAPPIELTGTGTILVLCFIFRNMPVGVRAGVAAMAQIDKNLDEASFTLGAGGWRTLRSVILPLLRPAILAALVYSFVRAMTAVSAVIFLVSAEHDMATSYIIGRVENNDYGLAIAYSTALIGVMLGAVLALQLLVGSRRTARRFQAGVRMEGAPA